MAYIDWEANAFHREDYYWAQIAEAIFKANASKKDREKIKMEDFILSFKNKPSEPKMTPKKRLEKQKAYWKGITGIARYGNGRT